MAKPGSSLPPWAEAGLYPASTYPLQLPWGVPNPVGGDPTPWSGQPRIDAAGLAAFADAGFTPQIPTPASPFNAYLNLVQQYIAWLEDGTSAGDANAHIMETDAIGLSRALAYEATASFQGAGGTPAPLANGATVSDGQTLTLTGGADILGGATAKIDVGDKVVARVIEMGPAGAAPTLRQLGAGIDDALVYNDGAGKFFHYSTNGRVYATGDQETSAAMGLDGTTATTSVATKGLGVGGNVRVIVSGLIQLAVLPNTFELFLQEDQTANPAYTTIGTASGEIKGTSDTSDATDWQSFRFERIFASGGTDATLYRLRVQADPTTAAVKEVRLRVESERA